MSLDRRITRLEQCSFLGSQRELDECEFLFMRVPEGYLADPQFEKTKAYVNKRGKCLICLDSPASQSLPFWALVTMDGLTDELLDEQVIELERQIAALQSPNAGEHRNEQAAQ